eukprot:6177253-Pleurochrysis_carterae.AAC.2
MPALSTSQVETCQLRSQPPCLDAHARCRLRKRAAMFDPPWPLVDVPSATLPPQSPCAPVPPRTGFNQHHGKRQ